MAKKIENNLSDLFMGKALLCPNPKCWVPEKIEKTNLNGVQLRIFPGQDTTAYCPGCGWIVQICLNKISFGKKIAKLIDCQACNSVSARFCRWCRAKKKSGLDDPLIKLTFTSEPPSPDQNVSPIQGLVYPLNSSVDSNEVFSGGQYLMVGNYLVYLTKTGEVFRVSPCSGNATKVTDLKIKGEGQPNINGVDHYLLASISNCAFVYNSALEQNNVWELDFHKESEKYELLSNLSIAYLKNGTKDNLLLAVVKSRKGARDKFYLTMFSLLPYKARTPLKTKQIELKLPDKVPGTTFQIFYVHKGSSLVALVMSETGYWECSIESDGAAPPPQDSSEYNPFGSPEPGLRKKVYLPIKMTSTEHHSSESCDRKATKRLELFVETGLLDSDYNPLDQPSKVEQIVFHLPERNQNISCYFHEIREGSILDQKNEAVAYLSNNVGQGSRPVFQFGFMGQENQLNEVSNYSAGLTFISERLVAWKAGNNKICLKKISPTPVKKSSEFSGHFISQYFEVETAVGYPFAYGKALVFPSVRLEKQNNINQLCVHWFFEK